MANVQKVIEREELSRVFGYMVALRVVALPVGVLVLGWVIWIEPALWRRVVLAAAMVTIPSFFLVELVRFRRVGLSRGAIPVNLVLASFVQLAVCFATGGVQSPFVLVAIPLGILTAVLIKPPLQLLVPLVQVASVWAMAYLGVTGLVPDFSLAAFGGGSRVGREVSHVWAMATMLTVVLVGSQFLGRALRKTFENILRRKLAAQQESLREHRERAEELTALSAEIAHELKNPLASVKGLSGLLAQHLPDGKGAERLGVLRREVDRMQSILDEFLNFSRPLVPLALGECDVAALCQEVAALHEGMARERSVVLTLEGTAVTARCDPRKVKQVLINLVQNALDASPQGDQVRVVAERGEGGGALVRVLDRGRGVDPMLGESVFLPGITTKSNGSGLGLTIARSLARQHGGDLLLRGRTGGGTEALLMLPAAPAELDPGEGRVNGEEAPARVLVVDDDPGVRYTLREILTSEGLQVDEAADGEEALARYDAAPAPLVLTDLRMPKLDGMGLLRELMRRVPAPRVVVITAHGSERQAVEATKAGAYDYFKKPFETEELLAVVRRSMEAVRLAHENEKLQGELALARSLVFASEAMRRLGVLVGRVAPRDVTVLITGESGTGKERVAEAIVRASHRAERPFVRFNCAALSPELAEAELFGHVRGAFTGAIRARPGLFGEADGGTILLDEVAELAPNAQAKLLRVLQEGEVRPVGEERARTVDVRVLAATHRDLEERVKDGLFREDLFYRLNVVHLAIPPLRSRPDDIPVLARFFLQRFAERFGVSPLHVPHALFERLLAHPWPGNVRELENALEGLVALSPPEGLDLGLLPGAAGTTALTGTPAPEHAPGAPLPLKQRVEAYERGLIVEALEQARGNRSEAARRLGMSRVTLHDKLKKYGLGSAGAAEDEADGGSQG